MSSRARLCRSRPPPRWEPRLTYRSHDVVAAELALHSNKEAMSPNGYIPPLPSVPPAAARDGRSFFFFSRIPWLYNLEDLLRTSGEVLNKGTYSTTCKATIESGPVMAVKRLKETSLSEREFWDKVAAISGIDHPNVLCAFGTTATRRRSP
ncbi:unnamed protein product [Miscanthus lutarioriparius]|uniref:Protein kinase domain-containing protein n=1 Tax=Miscanthus lutarioriparius TaxID=422564 RepID=A0A811M556_9POAL|nr:unnamed protein product [Miscanthus lutarioriparius]